MVLSFLEVSYSCEIPPKTRFDTAISTDRHSTFLEKKMLMQAEGELCVCELTHALNLSQLKITSSRPPARSRRTPRSSQRHLDELPYQP